MASPVNTEVKWARWTMPGAPVLTRAAGSLIALLDALLVDGWGLQTASSVVVSGGFATATFPTDHAAAPHSVVLVAGVTGALAGLNGEQKITSVEANKIRWATALPDGTAAGTITIKMAAAGWAKPFTGANLAAYKSASPAAHGQSLRLNDATAGYARVVGYETMTAISTGTGLFPSNAQVSGGYYWGKTAMTTGASAVPWALASDGRMLYLFTLTQHTPDFPEYGSCYFMTFGDMLPEAPGGDPFATLIGGSPTLDLQNFGVTQVINSYLDQAVAVPRARSGIGSSLRGALVPLASEQMGSPSLPNPITGAIPASPAYWYDGSYQFRRAHPPGLLFSSGQYAERLGVPKFGIVGGAGPQRAYLYAPASSGASVEQGLWAALVDITGPWR